MSLRRLLLLANLAWLLLLLVFLHLYLDQPPGIGPARVGDPLLVAGAVLLTVGFSLGCAWSAGRSLDAAAASIAQLAREGAGARPVVAGLVPRELEELLEGAQDLGRLLRAEAHRATAERDRLAEVLDHVSAGVLVTDREGRVVLANRALVELFQAEPPLLGRPAVEVVRHAGVEEAMSQALETRSEVVREIVLPAGPQRHLDLHVVPLVEDGVRGVVSAFYDITRMRQLERVRKDFVANVSHELRTPLTAIKGCAETLLDGAFEDPQAGLRFMQVIDAHAERLARLLDDLLSLARLESEQPEVHWEVCSLRRLVESCVSVVAASAQKKQIELALELPQDRQVRCDRKLVEQALINLLDNAVKYTGDGGRVRVSALPLHPGPAGATEAAGRLQVLRPRGDATDERVAVEIQDTGMGIPSQDLGRVFERFYRVDKGRSRAQGGTGLGLSIVRHVLEVHGEGLYVVSELGRGSTFGLTLPTVPA